MDHQEDIINLPTQRRNKMLIDSGDEDGSNGKIVNYEPQQVKQSAEKKQSAQPVKIHHKPGDKIDRKKLKYLFEPDESLSEVEEDQSESEVETPQPKRKLKVEQAKRSSQPVKQKQRDSVQVNSLEDLRWWYCFGEWPPVNYDYAEQLRLQKMRKVDYSVFKKEPEIDDKGYRKVYSVDGFPGIYKTSAGDTFDLRPQDLCPSLDNIKKINPKLLPKLYITGLKAQLDDLLKHEPQNDDLQQELRIQISKSEKKFQQYLEE